ncbi:MAG: hypothetical protein KAH20_11730 [Methylococcales bacterium]|nr:hypothetical protein [Methylococcales bacterium]
MIFKISRLAIKDFFNDWQISSCYILALAAVLGPMMVLFALKYGIISGMFGQLIDDPRNRELRPVYSGHFNIEWMEELKKRPDVSFLVPKTRSLAASMSLKSQNAPSIISVELIPTSNNDPLLSNILEYPKRFESIVLSKSVAKKLNVKSGDIISGSIQRRYRGSKEREHLPLKVVSIASSSAFTRDGAFTSLALLEAIESYRDGQAVPALEWPGSEPIKEEKYFTGFRLFSQSLQGVANLQKWLETQGVEVITKVDEIESVQNMEQTLSTIYWIIAMIGIIGFATSLGANLWANVERKRRELAIIRVIGFSTIDLIVFPVIQSLLTIFFGWLLAVAVYQVVSLWINTLMNSQLETGTQVCILLPVHYLTSLLASTLLAILVAALAGIRASFIEPAEGMREI